MSSIPATGSLQTELRNGDSTDIDIASTVDMCQIMNAADLSVAAAVKSCIPEIAKTIDLISERVRKGGRVIYIGAGTSGRLGILDASEIPPTFSAPYSQFIGLMAGGDTAIRRAVEGAEDSTTLPITDLNAISPALNSLDTLIGIAASGRTPYVLAGLAYGRSTLRMLTVGISCVQPSAMRGLAECLIECLVGPEIVTGSTRMKAGTATKLILNMISTGVMIRIGKTHGNLMVDVKTANNKLVDRARRIFRTLLPHTLLQDHQIDELITACGGSVKLALVVQKYGCSIEDARDKLDKAGGVLKRAWAQDPVDEHPHPQGKPQMVLCIDAGGTTCSVVIANADGIQARAEAGPCNFVTLGHDIALSTISTAVIRAISLLPEHLIPPKSQVSLPFIHPLFAAAWLGGAGLDRPADLASVHARVLKLLALTDPSTLLVTNDAALLSSAIVKHDTVANGIRSNDAENKTGVVLIMGTGSIAYSFRVTLAERKLVTAPLERTSGWGYLLGDEGSAYFIGREAVRRTLRHKDLGLPPTPFHKAVARHFGCDTIGGIISSVYAPNHFREIEDAAPLDSDPKLRIATLCPIVFGAAFPELTHSTASSETPQSGNKEALDIVNLAAEAVIDIVLPLVRDKDRLSAKDATLVLGGALGQVEPYRNLIVSGLRARGEVFDNVEVVRDAAASAVRLLVRYFLLVESR